MLNRILFFLSLVAIWLLISDNYTLFFLIAGSFSCLLTVGVYAKMRSISGQSANGSVESDAIFKCNPIVFLIMLLRDMVNNSFKVVKLIWQVEPKIQPIIGTVDLMSETKGGNILHANSITLIPGTVVVIVDDDQILVHALDEDMFNSIEGI